MKPMFEEGLIHYILDENNEIFPVETIDKWGNPNIENLTKVEECLRSPARQVAENFYLDKAIRVSTVFLSIPHIFKDRDDEALFETMVFADKAILQQLLELSERDDRSIISTVFGGFDIQVRYHTREEAIIGHQQMCAFIEVCLAKGLLTQQEGGTA